MAVLAARVLCAKNSVYISQPRGSTVFNRPTNDPTAQKETLNVFD